MGALAAGASAVSGLIGAFGAVQAGQEAKRTAFVQADRVAALGRDQLIDLERRREMTEATQRQSFASRGVSLAGSPLILTAETNALALRDSNRIRTDTNFQTYELRRAGRQAQTSGYINAAGALVGGAAATGQAIAYGTNRYAPNLGYQGQSLLSGGVAPSTMIPQFVG